jgi:hypothetical protein
MPHSHDWLPDKRADILIMANTWINVLVIKGAAWGVTAAELNALVDLTGAAEDALEKATTTDRGPESTAKCQAAFIALDTCMRTMKMQHFTQPPRTDAELVSVLLRGHDPNRTTQKTPVNQPGLIWNKWGPHLLGVKVITSLVVDPNEEGYGVRIFSGLVKPGIPVGERPSSTRFSDKYNLLSSPPLSARDLTSSFFTKRKTEIFRDLPDESSGMILYAAANFELEKGGPPGPTGPMISAFVP